MSGDFFDEPDEYEYFSNKRPDRSYISKMFEGPRLQPLLSQGRPESFEGVRLLEERSEFVRVDGEIVLRVTPAEKQEVKAVFYEDTLEFRNIIFQRFTR